MRLLIATGTMRMSGLFFLDPDNDGDQDLYVVSGGNEYEPGILIMKTGYMRI